MGELYEILAKAAMRLSAPATQSIDDADFSVLEFDEVTVQRGGFNADPSTNSITVPSSGLYSVHIGVDGTFPGSEMLELMVFVDGAAYSPNSLVLQGRANQKPVSLYWESTVDLVAGATIDVRGRNGESGSFNLNFQRMYLCMIKEH